LPPEAPVIDPVRLFDQVARAFRERSGEGRFVLMIDDLHLLDGTSTTLIEQLLGAGVVFLIGTVRAGQITRDVVTSLWHSDRVARIDLEDLPRESFDTLLHLALGGPVEGATAAMLWEASRGNVLFLRE